MKRRIVALALLAAGCSRGRAPLRLPPPAGEMTLSVLEPDGPDRCVWKRAEPGGESVLCRIDRPCDAVTVQFSGSGSNAFAAQNLYQAVDWICPASGAPQVTHPFPTGSRSNGMFGFDDAGSIVLVWNESRLPSLRDRIVARLHRQPRPAVLEMARSAHLTASGWREDAVTSPLSLSSTDLATAQAASLLQAPPPPPMLRLVSEALPAAHPEVRWQALMTKPGPSFLQVQGGALTGPLVFVLRDDESKVAPQSPAEFDEVTVQIRGSLVLLQRTGQLGTTYPRLWDAATGELLWSDPKAVRAVFWPNALR